MIGPRHYPPLIIQEDDQIRPERLPPLFELIGDAHQVDDRRGWMGCAARRRGRFTGQRFLNVSHEGRVIAQQLRRQGQPAQSLTLKFLEEPCRARDRGIHGRAGDAISALDGDSHRDRHNHDDEQRGQTEQLPDERKARSLDGGCFTDRR